MPKKAIRKKNPARKPRKTAKRKKQAKTGKILKKSPKSKKISRPRKTKQVAGGRKRKNPLKSLGALLLIWQFLVFQVFAPFNISVALAADDSGATLILSEPAGSDSASSQAVDDGDNEVEDTGVSFQSPPASGDEEDEGGSGEGEDSAQADESPAESSTENEGGEDEESDDPDQSAGGEPQNTSEPEEDEDAEGGTDADNSGAEVLDATGAKTSSVSGENEGELESWEICSFDAEEQNLFEKEGEEYEECRMLPSCPEIKECLAKCKVVIGQTNHAENSENNSIAVSDTGNNTIVQEGDPEADVNSAEDPAEDDDEDDENSNDDGEEENETECNCQDPACENPDLCGEARIESGDALSIVNAVNQVNTNIFSENGGEIVQNIEGENSEDVNLLEIFENVVEKANDLNLGNQEAFQIIDISAENTANLVNNAVSEAGTGGNSIEGSLESAEIDTGNASAFLNVVNLVNQNIVGANWLLAIVNVFGNWSGDLIVPGEGLLTFSENAGFSIGDVVQENHAEVVNSAVASASTGNDSIEGNLGNASIMTGNADSNINAVNVVNTNIVRNNWFFLMINNMGSWVGQVLNWNGEAGQYDNVYSFDFGTIDGGGSGMPGGIVNVFSKNTAYVENNAAAIADTGGNSISGESGDASIKTGNATAWANIFNFINTNIVGNNWMLGIVNVMGEWSGDVVFGYPDIAVSMSGDRAEVRPGENFAYILSCENKGEAFSENVKLKLVLPKSAVYQSDSSGSAPDSSGREYNWTFAGLEAGEKKSFRVDVLADPSLAEGGIYALEGLAGAKTDTEERNLQNNFASAVVPVNFSGYGVASLEAGDSQIAFGNAEIENAASELKISRENESSGPYSVGDVVDRRILVENTGGSALHDIKVTEKIKTPSGENAEFDWTIDALESGQNAVIEYQLSINPGIESGKYKCVAVASGYDEADQKVDGGEASSNFRVKAEEIAYYQEEYYDQNNNGFLEDAGIVEGIQASEIPSEEKIQKSWSNGGVCLGLPWWGWGVAVFLYFAALHWALLRQKRIINPVKIEK